MPEKLEKHLYLKRAYGKLIIVYITQRDCANCTKNKQKAECILYKVLKYVIIFLLDDNFLSFLHARTLQARRTAASCTQGAISLPPAYLCARPHTRANSANSGIPPIPAITAIPAIPPSPAITAIPALTLNSGQKTC